MISNNELYQNTNAFYWSQGEKLFCTAWNCSLTYTHRRTHTRMHAGIHKHTQSQIDKHARRTARPALSTFHYFLCPWQRASEQEREKAGWWSESLHLRLHTPTIYGQTQSTGSIKGRKKTHIWRCVSSALDRACIRPLSAVSAGFQHLVFL